MKIKQLEIRDRGTFIPVLAIAVSGCDGYLMRRAGFGLEQRLILVVKLTDMKSSYDPYGWGSGARTMQTAHQHIEKQWDEIQSEDVIDVEYILGEKPTCKTSERFTAGF